MDLLAKRSCHQCEFQVGCTLWQRFSNLSDSLFHKTPSVGEHCHLSVAVAEMCPVYERAPQPNRPTDTPLPGVDLSYYQG